jgi:acyl-CoA thioester hydrolase
MFKYEIKPRYVETDQMGVIHHSVYPIYYEATRVAFCESIGLPFHKIEEIGLMQALKNMHSEYIFPARFGDTLQVVLRISEYTKVKLTFSYEVFNQEHTLIHRGYTQLVWLDKHFKICNIEKHFKHVYETLLPYAQEDIKKQIN